MGVTVAAVADDRYVAPHPNDGGAAIAVQDGLIRTELNGRCGMGTFHCRFEVSLRHLLDAAQGIRSDDRCVE